MSMVDMIIHQPDSPISGFETLAIPTIQEKRRDVRSLFIQIMGINR